MAKGEKGRSTLVKVYKYGESDDTIIVSLRSGTRLEVGEYSRLKILDRVKDSKDHYFQADVYRSGKVVLHEERFNESW